MSFQCVFLAIENEYSNVSLMKPRILVVEDESSIAEALVYALETDGFQPVRVSTGRDGLALLKEKSFDLVILDVGLPDETGFEICKKIRKFSEVPIFFLTARNTEIDKIVGLEIGADDYITKPFSPREVTARIKSLFRRLEGKQSHSAPAKMVGKFQIDEAKYQISYDQVSLSLTRYEYGILKVLLRRPGQVYSREQLMQEVWDEPEMALDRTIDTHIKSLRIKLRQAEPDEEIILTHRGIGYSLKEQN
jgi:two-component system catabolic regulation response regulator CreB